MRVECEKCTNESLLVRIKSKYLFVFPFPNLVVSKGFESRLVIRCDGGGNGSELHFDDRVRVRTAKTLHFGRV